MSDLARALDAIDTAMGVVKSIADTPGINLIPYVSTASSVISAVHTAYTAGKNIMPYVQAIQETFSGDGAPTPEQLAALDARIEELEGKVQEPLPAAEDGEAE